MKFSATNLIATIATLWVLGASAEAAGIPTNLRENGAGFRVQLTRATDGRPLASEAIEARIIPKDRRADQFSRRLVTDGSGIVSIPASSGIEKVVFTYAGSGAYRSVRVTDSRR